MSVIADLCAAADRFMELLDSVKDPGETATGTWSIAETAAHVRSVAALDAHFVSGAEPPPELTGFVADAVSDRASIHASLTAAGVAWAMRGGDAALRRGLVTDVGRLAASLASRGAAEVPWLGGMTLPAEAVGAHMISELLVHGFDIASAEGRPFDVREAEARHFFGAFVPAVIPAAHRSGFFDVVPKKLAPVKWKFDVRGGRTSAFGVVGGRVTALDASHGPFDFTVSARADALLLVMYRRLAPVWPALRGRIAVWGPRPWRLSRMRAAVQTL